MKANILKLSICAIILTVGFSSCEKNYEKEQDYLERKGGEDTDTPIMIGFAVDGSEEPIYPAEVELFDINQTIKVDETSTDEYGGFQFTMDSGYYYVKLYENEQLRYISDTVEVSDSTYLPIQL
jgi:hypothetical protein